MAIRNIDPKAKDESSGSEAEMKPLVSKYARKNPEIYKEVHIVTSGKVSSSGDWCVLETEEYTVLMSMKTSAMKELFENILPALANKKANALVIQPTKKAKCGAIVAVDDEQTLWYSYDSEDESFETSVSDPKKDTKKSSSLNLSMFLDTTASTDSVSTTQEEQKNRPNSTRTRKVQVAED